MMWEQGIRFPVSYSCYNSETFRMTKVYPFRALRYDPARVALQQVVTQPYDKITPELQEAYCGRDPHNLVRIELGKKQHDDSPVHNVYTRAAKYLQEWRRIGILRR